MSSSGDRSVCLDRQSRRIDQLERLPRLDSERVERIELLVRIEVENPYPEREEPTMLLDRYFLEVLVLKKKGEVTSSFVLGHSLVDLSRTREYGKMYIAWDEADQVLEQGKSPLCLVRNEILDHRLLPRDPHYQTKVMATVIDALDRIREATGISDLARYQLWFVREGTSWTEHPLDEVSLGKTRQEARAIRFEPPGCVPAFITGLFGVEEGDEE